MATEKRTIEAYDDYAEKWAERMRSGRNIAHEYLEKPAMYAKLPDLVGKDVLCIGCGTGEECAHLKSLGARRVLGVDLSSGLIDFARKSYPDLEFAVMDMEKLELAAGSFDFAYSSLVMHYVDSWERPLAEVRRVLKSGARFLFSTHHPTLWGAERLRDGNGRTSLLGYRKLSEGGCEVVGDYLNGRKIDDVWFGDFPVTYVHRPMASLLNDIAASGLSLVSCDEPKAVGACREVDPVFWEIHQKIPLFLVFELTR